MIRELVCKIAGHTPAFIRTERHEMENGNHSFTVELGCARCGEVLDTDDYDHDELLEQVDRNHRLLRR